MKQAITRERFTDAMHKAVASRGEDYVYTPPEGGRMCMYTDPDGTPGCIVGVALAELGYTAENTDSLAYGKGGGAAYQLTLLGFVDPHVHEAANYAQRVQDTGGTWGVALNQYNRIMTTAGEF